jgi:predicted acylesterase/phospholipase RssA/CRP-like cAMP-binding protein
MREHSSDLRREQLAAHLNRLLDTADPAALAMIEAEAEWIAVAGGQTLFRRGDPGDAAYIVISGRLRVMDDADGGRMLNEVGAGETIGEMALLSGEPRSATVYAVRDSLLARLPAESFHRLVERHPRMLRRITGFLVERLRRQGTAMPRAGSGAKTLAIVPAGEHAEVTAFAQRLEAALATIGPTLRLDAQRVDRTLGHDGIARSGEHDLASLGLVQWLNEQELAHRFVVYQTEPRTSAWTDRAVRQADQVLFVADANSDAAPSALERALAERWRGARAPRRSLAILHARNAAPADAAAFLAARAVDCHYHLLLDADEDYARLARCLAGEGIGLVLSGGGARGLAHLGVYRALVEAGVPIDWVGGTSIGALIGALVAMRLSPDAADACAREHFTRLRDPTLPVVSLLAGRRIRAQIEHALGPAAIEDLPLPYLCVSTNLSRAAQTVHERGPLARAIRASISLPGILPPVALERDFHVDGGLLNNLPIDVMAAKPEIGAVIAVDVSNEVEMRAAPDLESDVSGWRLLWQRLNPRVKRTRVPGIMALLTRSALVASIRSARERRAAETASLYLHVPVADLRLLDFARLDEIAARGYQSTHTKIRAWWEAKRA